MPTGSSVRNLRRSGNLLTAYRVRIGWWGYAPYINETRWAWSTIPLPLCCAAGRYSRMAKRSATTEF